jgi:Family of unknown function (DUF5715)
MGTISYLNRWSRILLAVLLTSGTLFAVSVAHPPKAKKHHHATTKRSLYSRLRYPWWHPVFPPSHESLVSQNAEIDRLGLPRFQDELDLVLAIDSHQLVPLPLSPALIVDPRLDPTRRYCRAWTAQFLTDLSNDFYTTFHEPIMVDSAVRTVQVQKKLRRYNHNAAPIDGEAASSHLAGLTIDLARKRMTKAEVRWIELRLLYYHARGWVIVEEEHAQLCFHIMVSGRYGEPIETTTSDTGINLIDQDDGDYAAPQQ